MQTIVHKLPRGRCHQKCDAFLTTTTLLDLSNYVSHNAVRLPKHRAIAQIAVLSMEIHAIYTGPGEILDYWPREG